MGKMPRWPKCSRLPMQLSGVNIHRAMHNGSSRLCTITGLCTYVICTYLELSIIDIPFIKMGLASFYTLTPINHLSGLTVQILKAGRLRSVITLCHNSGKYFEQLFDWKQNF